MEAADDDDIEAQIERELNALTEADLDDWTDDPAQQNESDAVQAAREAQVRSTSNCFTTCTERFLWSKVAAVPILLTSFTTGNW